MTNPHQGWRKVEISTPNPPKTTTPTTRFRRSTQQGAITRKDRDTGMGGYLHPSTPQRQHLHPASGEPRPVGRRPTGDVRECRARPLPRDPMRHHHPMQPSAREIPCRGLAPMDPMRSVVTTAGAPLSAHTVHARALSPQVTGWALDSWAGAAEFSRLGGGGCRG